MMFLFPKVGYVNSLEGICLTTWSPLLCLPRGPEESLHHLGGRTVRKGEVRSNSERNRDAETEEVVWN